MWFLTSIGHDKYAQVYQLQSEVRRRVVIKKRGTDDHSFRFSAPSLLPSPKPNVNRILLHRENKRPFYGQIFIGWTAKKSKDFECAGIWQNLLHFHYFEIKFFFCNKIKLYFFFSKGALLKEYASRNKRICNIPNKHTRVTVYCQWILFVIIYTRKKETNRIK